MDFIIFQSFLWSVLNRPIIVAGDEISLKLQVYILCTCLKIFSFGISNSNYTVWRTAYTCTCQVMSEHHSHVTFSKGAHVFNKQKRPQCAVHRLLCQMR